MTFLALSGGPLAALPQLAGSMSEAAPAERRWTVQLYKAWEAARMGHALPCVADFDLGVIEALGPNCFLLEIERGSEEARFRYFGRELAAQTGRDFTGQMIASLPRPSLLTATAGQYPQAVARRRPIGWDGQFALNVEEHLAYRCVLLPFATPGGHIDSVLGCVRLQRRKGKAATAPLPRVAIPAPRVGEAPAATAGAPCRELRTTLALARQSVVVTPDEEPRRPALMHILPDRRRSLRGLLSPGKSLPRARLAPAIGRAVLAQPHDGAFAVLIARRVEGEPRRYDVIAAAADPFAVNLALRWVDRKSRKRLGQAGRLRPGKGK